MKSTRCIAPRLFFTSSGGPHSSSLLPPPPPGPTRRYNMVIRRNDNGPRHGKSRPRRIQWDRSFYCSYVMKGALSPDLQWLRWPQHLSQAVLFDDLFLKNREKLTFTKSTASPKFHVHYDIVRAELMRSRVCSMSVPRVLHSILTSIVGVVYVAL